MSKNTEEYMMTASDTTKVKGNVATRLVGNVGNNALKGISGVGAGMGKGYKAAGSVLDDFKKFINKGNVVDLAVGLVIGAAFASVVSSLVSDILTPIFSLAMQANLQNNYLILRCPPNPTNGTVPMPKYSNCGKSDWKLVTEAQKAGAVTWNWGNFVNSVLNFLVIGGIIFFLLKIYTAARRPQPKPKTTKECSYCCKEIPIKATRCPECTSHIEEPETTVVPESVIDIVQDGPQEKKVV
ncbi:hypothetical protein PhCBS80983_g02431 [Powellomyces hirtus]|uniref:Large conductance mechanosensitive channel protein n=1 Tax=Powellomyces hirtus TaxID=109895 RepID=A0A507E650_9FUNG|nr:hypothetical protein PhCBS80983_g02431 [Powellomyces hirtus]